MKYWKCLFHLPHSIYYFHVYDFHHWNKTADYKITIILAWKHLCIGKPPWLSDSWVNGRVLVMVRPIICSNMNGMLKQRQVQQRNQIHTQCWVQSNASAKCGRKKTLARHITNTEHNCISQKMFQHLSLKKKKRKTSFRSMLSSRSVVIEFYCTGVSSILISNVEDNISLIEPVIFPKTQSHPWPDISGSYFQLILKSAYLTKITTYGHAKYLYVRPISSLFIWNTFSICTKLHTKLFLA